jgi:hypothetical protein
VPDPADATRTVRSDQFRPGAVFRHAVDLFDKQLGLLFLDAIERIEVALRVDLARALGKLDPWVRSAQVAPKLAALNVWFEAQLLGLSSESTLARACRYADMLEALADAKNGTPL